MDWKLAVLMLSCLAPFVLSRQLSAAALAELPDDKKLELVNISAKGRKYLWLWLLPLVVAAVFSWWLLWLLLTGMAIGMVAGNQWWIRKHGFPPAYVRRHLYAGLMLVLAVIAPVATMLSWSPLSRFLAVDRCLDQGGSYDYRMGACAHSRSYP